jgi:hypothetical protein
MAKLTSKYLSGASKLEKQNFNLDSFNSAGATYMDVDKAMELMGEAKTILTKIHKSYERIEASYKKALGKACTASGKKMDTSKGPGKSIKKYYKAADRRAKAVSDRKKTLTNQMEKIQLAVELQNNTYAKNLETKANAASNVNANEN